MKKIIEIEFGIIPIEITRLNGYENINYHVRTNSHSFIFKTYPYTKSNLSLIESENKALLFLQEPSNSRTPEPIPFKDGAYVKNIEIEGEQLSCRLLSFLNGTFIADSAPDIELISSLGTFLGNLDQQLMSFDDPILRSRKCEWDIQQLHLNRKYISDISEKRNQSVVRYFFMQFEAKVQAELSELRMAYIHSDANEYNILIDQNQVSALIDFGDMVYAPLINELATAVTYMCYDKENIFDFALPLIHAYHQVIPLQEKEISLLTIW